MSGGLGRWVFHCRQASIHGSCAHPSSAAHPTNTWRSARLSPWTSVLATLETLGPLLRHRPLRRPCGLRTRRRVVDCADPGSKIISSRGDCSIAAVAVPDPATRAGTPPTQGGGCPRARANEGSAGCGLWWCRGILETSDILLRTRLVLSQSPRPSAYFSPFLGGR